MPATENAKPEPTNGVSEQEPRARAWIGDSAGNRTPVPDDQIEGLDEFVSAWGRDVSFPEPLLFEGWQQADDDHPPGRGGPGYRLVFKTIRLATFPAVQMLAGNLRLLMDNGPVVTGEPRMVGALAERTPGSFLLPEWGCFTGGDDAPVAYATEPARAIHIDNHEDVTPAGNYLEILYSLPDRTPDTFAAQLAAGRAAVAPLLVELELRFGPRLLGPVLAEEVGAIFEDGHWNRRLGGRLIRTEAQASMQHLPGDVAVRKLQEMAARRSAISDEERQRTQIASQWYLRGKAEGDLTSAYIAFWLVLEALELGENINIAPLKRVTAEILGVEQQEIAGTVGRLYGTRSRLVHGQQHAADEQHLAAVEALAEALLERHMVGDVSGGRAETLRRVLTTASQTPTE